MFPTFMHEVDQLSVHIEQKVTAGEPVELKNTLVLYVLNVVGSVFFGLEANCFKDPNNEFKRIHASINSPKFKDNVRTALLFLAPGVIDFFRMEQLRPDIKDFFLRITSETISYREQNNVRRNDFIQQTIDLMNDEKALGTKTLTVESIAGNSFLFYIAGTETSSATAGFMLYEMAKLPKVQQRVQQEIDEVLARSKGEITYDGINEMKYLDLCVKGETFRRPHSSETLIRVFYVI